MLETAQLEPAKSMLKTHIELFAKDQNNLNNLSINSSSSGYGSQGRPLRSY